MPIHINALFTHDDHNRLKAVNEPDGTPAPRFFLGKTAAGNTWRFRHDLPADLVEQLEALCIDESVADDLRLSSRRSDAYLSRLEEHAPVRKVWAGPAYRFPEATSPTSGTVVVTDDNADLLSSGFEEWLPDIPSCQPFLASVQGGHAVSICASVRTTSEALEAGVETLTEHRGQGHATRVVAAWANAVREIGLIPLYSTSWENVASRGVAQKLGLVLYGADFHIT